MQKSTLAIQILLMQGREVAWSSLSPSAVDPELDGLVTVLDLVRSGAAVTRPALMRASGLGRAVVSQRVGQLLEYGLLEEGTLGRSTGGRAPRELRLRADAGVVLTAFLGATHAAVALTNLAGDQLERHDEELDVAHGPEAVLGRVEALLDRLLASAARPPGAALFGVGVGLPGPVEFASGRPINPPIMPGWDAYPVRDRLVGRYDTPVWVDNEVNLMALGELRAGLARGENDVIFVKIGTGVGAGLISGGRLHRGAQGCAGDIGHVAVDRDSGVICRCGNVGCLEALAGGAALARDGAAAARDGRSAYLRQRLDSTGQIEAVDVARAAQHGDPLAVELLVRTGRLVGETLATLVNFFDPSVLLLGGGVTEAGNLVLAAMRESVYRRSLPLATRDLRITLSPLGDDAGVLGAAAVVVDELFSRELLGHWLHIGSPQGRPELALA